MVLPFFFFFFFCDFKKTVFTSLFFPFFASHRHFDFFHCCFHIHSLNFFSSFLLSFHILFFFPSLFYLFYSSTFFIFFLSLSPVNLVFFVCFFVPALSLSLSLSLSNLIHPYILQKLQLNQLKPNIFHFLLDWLCLAKSTVCSTILSVYREKSWIPFLKGINGWNLISTNHIYFFFAWPHLISILNSKPETWVPNLCLVGQL